MLLNRWMSRRGREITVSLISSGSKTRLNTVRIAYEGGKSPGRVAYFPEGRRFQPQIDQIVAYFREDRDTLGRPFGRASIRRRGQLSGSRALYRWRERQTPGRAPQFSSMEEGFDLLDRQIDAFKAKLDQVKQKLREMDGIEGLDP